MMHCIDSAANSNHKPTWAHSSTLFYFTAFLLSLSSLAYAIDIHKSVSVIFRGDRVNLPAGKALHICDTTTILSEEVLHLLEPYHDVFINRTFEENDSGYIIVEGRDGITVEQPTLKGVYNLTFDDSLSAASAAADLMHSSDVLSATQNCILEFYRSPVDDYIDAQWAINNTGQFIGTPGTDINAEGAWDYDTGSVNVIIGILDTGVDLGADDLIGKVIGDQGTGWHGTFVAAIAGAKTNNEHGIAGINWASTLLSKDIHDLSWDVLFSKTIEAVNEGADVLNESGGTYYGSPLQGKACAFAYNMDRVFVAAAGNSYADVLPWPADFKQVISVAATDYNDELCHEVDWGSNHGPNIDVSAPGKTILSTKGSLIWEYESGTSFAAPYVTGLASLLKSYNQDLWNDDIRNIIQLSAEDLAPLGFDTAFGWGRIDAQAAFELMQIPNTLNNTDSAFGSNYDYWISGQTELHMYGMPFLPDDVYKVKVYEVRCNVTFDRPYFSIPAAWGRGAGSVNSGFVFQVGLPVFNFRDCEVVPGSVSTTGCTVSSHVYEVWRRHPGTGYWYNVGFRPVPPADVVFPYSVLGEYTLLLPTITTVTPDFENNRALIGWDDVNPNDDRIIVKRKVGSGGGWSEWQDISQGDVTSTYQSDLSQLVGSELYSYKVVFLNEHQETNNSQAPVASFRNLANAPQNVSVWSSTYQGYPMPKTYVSWTAPANQLANSIDHYEVKVQYSPTDIRWYDTTTTTIEFCVDYDEDIQVTVYAVDDWEVQGRASSTINFETPPMYEWTNCIPPGGGGNLIVPDSGEIGKLALPTEFALGQNYPNPFNPVTAIALSVPIACETRIEVFNMLGQHIRTLFDGALAAGKHQFEWDSRDDAGAPVSSGVYFYRVAAGAFSETRKMLLLK